MTDLNRRASRPDAAGDLAGALDMLLADGALGVLRRFRPDGALLRLAASLAQRPQLVSQQVAALGAELAKIATGSSQLAPERKDRRFADPAWSQNPLLKRSLQAYLAAGQTATGLSPAPSSTGEMMSGCGSCSRTSSPRRLRATTRCSTRPPSRRLSTPAG